jgi:predicted nucleic acid-binding protein
LPRFVASARATVSVALTSMIEMRFVDTNILLYALSKAADEKEKSHKALAILDSEDLAISTQVLQAFYVQATRPTKADRVTHKQATSL